MRRAAIVPLLGLLVLGCKTETRTPGGDEATPAKADPIDAALASEVVSNMDAAVSPCDDFYRYACGGWIDRTELPADQPRYGRFQALRQRNSEALRTILENASTSEDPGSKMLGTFYGACMDQAAIDAAGLGALKPTFDEVAKLDAKSLMKTVGSLRLVGVPVLFDFDIQPEDKDPTTNIAHLSQGGLGLPDRDYYLGEGERAESIRKAYVEHVAAMLSAGGFDAAAAPKVFAFEKALAEASTPRAELRDPELRYNRMTRDALAKLAPKLDWNGHFEALGHPDMDQLNVFPPAFFTAMGEAVAATDKRTLRAYVQFHILHRFADQLPKAFSDANYDFYSKTLRGQAEPAPRWKKCVATTDGSLRDMLGQLYVQDNFAGDSRGVALEMITSIEAAFERGLPQLAWMDDGTRARAVEKMKAIVNKIGYPQQWRDYSTLELGDVHMSNVLAASRYESARRLSHYNKPVDELEWHMSPPTVNAYYNPPFNEMVFPAGILQPPFFAADFPMAMNFGGIGMVMGHELTHGFDDQGRKYDGDGRLRQWWDEGAATRFEERAQCVEELYDGYEVQPGVTLNGKLTLGENIADFGGIKQAHQAYLAWAADNGQDPKAQALEGLTSEQLLFVAFGQLWCSKATPEIERALAVTDPHSNPRWRINGPLSHLPGFWEAFSCEEGAGMRPTAENVCEVW